MSREPTTIVSKSIVRNIAQGAVGLPPWLITDRGAQALIVLPVSCIIEGLEMAETATCDGLRALARLICISQLVLHRGRIDAAARNRSLPKAWLTADVLLSCLIGIIKADTLADLAKQAGLTTNDALLVAALLCTEKEDNLSPCNLAQALQVVTLELVDPSTTNRSEWPDQLSEEGIERIRTKAIMAKRRAATE